MYLSGYQGFLNLCDLVGSTHCSPTLRSQTAAKLNEYLNFRQSHFSTDPHWTNRNRQSFSIAANFMWLTPVVGDLYGQNSTLLPLIQNALTEYYRVAPQWFIGGNQIGY